MLYIALTELIIIVLLVAAAEIRTREFNRVQRDAADRFAQERSELLTRIQHPEYIIQPERELPEVTEPFSDMDEFERVGKIIYGSQEDED